MKDKPYHHGNLQTELIEEGLALIHEEGRGNFSLRKLAKRLGVSPAACYNHYSTAEELQGEMKRYVTEKFCSVLIERALEADEKYAMINMGKGYIRFFADNPHYFSYIYDNADYRIALTGDSFEGDFEPFRIFKEAAIKCMEYNHIGKEHYRDNLVVMWATVHGLAAMANMGGFHYDGDWEMLAEKLLVSKILLEGEGAETCPGALTGAERK